MSVPCTKFQLTFYHDNRVNSDISKNVCAENEKKNGRIVNLSLFRLSLARNFIYTVHKNIYMDSKASKQIQGKITQDEYTYLHLQLLLNCQKKNRSMRKFFKLLHSRKGTNKSEKPVKRILCPN